MRRSSVAGMFRANVADLGDKPMFRFQGTTVTWAEHHERACRVAQALLAEGVGAGDRVAFLDRNGLEYFEVLFGGALLGAVNVAVNWRLAPAEMAAVIDDAEATVLVVHPDYVPCLAAMESGLPWVSARGGPRRPQGRRRRRRRLGPRPTGRLRGLARRSRRRPTPGTRARPTTCRCSSTRRGRPGCPRA